MPEREEQFMNAQLYPVDLKVVYSYVRLATHKTLEQLHCLKAAYHELEAILGVRRDIDKGLQFDKFEEIQKTGQDQYKFSHSAVIGIQIGFTQWLIGTSHPEKLKADVAAQIEALELCSKFSRKFVELVKKTAKIQDVEPSKVKLEDVFDDEPEEAAAPVEAATTEEVPAEAQTAP